MLESYTDYFQKSYGDQAEFIVVVNGSTDNTPNLAKRLAESKPGIRCLIENESIGKGEAIVRGFALADGQMVGFVDADGSTSPDVFAELARNLNDAGAIIASRRAPGARVTKQAPLLRRAGSRIFNGLVRLLFGLRISDTQCGAKLLSRPALEAVLPSLRNVSGWAFDLDLLLRLRKAGFRIVEWPTRWMYTPGSNIHWLRSPLEMGVALCRLRLLHSPFYWVVDVYEATVGKMVDLHKS